MRRFSTIIAIALSTLLFISICTAQQIASPTPITATPATTSANTDVPNFIRPIGTLKDAQGRPPSSTMAAASTIFPFTPWGSMFAAPGVSTPSPQEILIFGLEHTALGNAKLAFPAVRTLIVTNIGTGGGDGVSVALPPATAYWDSHFNGLDPQSYEPGSFFQITTIATINGIPGQTATIGRITDTGSQWSINFDFSRVSSGPLLAEYFLGGREGTLVGVEIVPQNLGPWSMEVDLATSWAGTSPVECPNCLKDVVITAKGPGVFTSPFGAPFFADTLEVTATTVDVTSFIVSSASLTASGIPTFTINAELLNTTPPSSMTAANLFTVGGAGNFSVDQIDLGVGFVAPPDTFTASVWTDNAGLPGTQVAGALWNNLTTTQPFLGCCGLVTISGISGVTLVGGQSYFMILGPVSLTDTSLNEWNWNNQGVNGLDLYSTDGGSTWNSNGTGNPLGAFDVQGNQLSTGTPADTLFSDLGPPGNTYQCCNGWQVSGLSGAGGNQPSRDTQRTPGRVQN